MVSHHHHASGTDRPRARLRVKDVFLGLFAVCALATILQSRTQLHKELVSNIKIKTSQEALLRAAEGRRLAEVSRGRRLEERVTMLENEINDLKNEAESLREARRQGQEACERAADEEKKKFQAILVKNEEEIETANQQVTDLGQNIEKLKDEIDSCDMEKLNEERKAIYYENEVEIMKRAKELNNNQLQSMTQARDVAISERDAARDERDSILERESHAMTALDNARTALQQFSRQFDFVEQGPATSKQPVSTTESRKQPSENRIVHRADHPDTQRNSEQDVAASDSRQTSPDEDDDKPAKFTVVKDELITPEHLELLSRKAAEQEEERALKAAKEEEEEEEESIHSSESNLLGRTSEMKTSSTDEIDPEPLDADIAEAEEPLQSSPKEEEVHMQSSIDQPEEQPQALLSEPISEVPHTVSEISSLDQDSSKATSGLDKAADSEPEGARQDEFRSDIELVGSDDDVQAHESEHEAVSEEELPHDIELPEVEREEEEEEEEEEESPDVFARPEAGDPDEAPKIKDPEQSESAIDDDVKSEVDEKDEEAITRNDDNQNSKQDHDEVPLSKEDADAAAADSRDDGASESGDVDRIRVIEEKAESIDSPKLLSNEKSEEEELA